MSEYQFKAIEKKWQSFWKTQGTFKTEFPSTKPKYYVLDMFPYPSGAGLHVGHPLGYIATDIISRYKRLQGYNVLHPMGYDSFGLPAEQYAVQTGQHPAVTTKTNIDRYREQMDALGFSFDWDREVRTSEPNYYKWTQWIFSKLFNSWYNLANDRAEPIETLVEIFKSGGSTAAKAHQPEHLPVFSVETWINSSEDEQYRLLLPYRLAYLSNATVNWCPALGTVLANEEVKDGLSERGGHPVVRKEMPQWSLRITAYADRLLADLDLIDWPEAVKEMQRNWIGRSKGCMLKFNIVGHEECIWVFTTRIDTTFGVTYVTLAPEHELVSKITSREQQEAVDAYLNYAVNRSERDRMSDVKTVTGCFTGAYAINPFNDEKIPIWIGEYVLAGYGTGAVMAVPSSDTRDFDFAQKFGLPIIPVQEGAQTDITQADFDPKAGTMINSGFLNGLKVPEAIEKAIAFVEEKGFGYARINYKMRDAIFSRQRYWGEPFPIYFKNQIPYLIPEADLPVVLPEVDQFKPTENGEPPLARAENWTYTPKGSSEAYPIDANTMPGWAGSSWYFLRFMDAQNESAFASKEALAYWQEVDLYLGGSEHATGHLLYARFWHKFLYDYGLVPKKEFAAKLINQGMIQGRSNFVYRVDPKFDFEIAISSAINRKPIFLSYNLADQYSKSSELKQRIDKIISEIYLSENVIVQKDQFKEIGSITPIHIDVKFVENDILNFQYFSKDNRFKDYQNAIFILEGNNGDPVLTHSEGKYICGFEVEKMSKSKHNVVNPDDVIEKFGTDTLRLYEMFLGPLEMSKPWNTNSISGVSRFLRNVWRLFYNDQGKWMVEDAEPTKGELKTLHKTIKKIEEDIDRISLNTSVSNFMVCVNELHEAGCHKKSILEPFIILLSPYAPHICEELYEQLGHSTSISFANFPKFDPNAVIDDHFEYPVSINGKLRAKLSFDTKATVQTIEAAVLAHADIQKWLEGKAPKKVIVVPNKIVNIVL